MGLRIGLEEGVKDYSESGGDKEKQRNADNRAFVVSESVIAKIPNDI
jgi:hypothetical protein